MWWLIWGALVAGTVVGAFFLGRDLWRKAVALGRALADASQAMSDASARIGDAVDQATMRPIDTSPTIFGDVTALREHVAALRVARTERAQERRQRQAATARAWSVEGWLAARHAQQAASRSSTHRPKAVG